MIRTIRSGKVIERSQFFVGERKPRKDRKKGSSSLTKMDANQNQAVRRLARILNCNFEHKDLFVTLTYDDAHIPASAEAAEREVSLFMRRLGRALAKIEADPQYVFITADRDEESGEAVRLHHHLVIQGWDTSKTKALEKIWKNGFVHSEHLREQEDYTPLAAYLVKQAVNGPDQKKWHSSRNMKKPVIESEKIVDHPKELRAPGGASVQEIGHYEQETGSHYIRYIRKPRKKKEESYGTPQAGFIQSGITS